MALEIWGTSQLLRSCNEDTFSVDIFTRQLDVWGGGGNGGREGSKAVDASVGYFGQKQTNAFS